MYNFSIFIPKHPRFEVIGNTIIDWQVNLPPTGQTTVHQTGDDGSVQAHHTPLMWVKNVALMIPGFSATEYVNTDIVDYWGMVENYVRGDIVVDDNELIYGCLKPNNINSVALDNTEYWEPMLLGYRDQSGGMMTWGNAITYISNLTYAGVSGWSATNPLGWRLPNIYELTSILNCGGTANAKYDIVCPANPAYPSSTTCVGVDYTTYIYGCTYNIAVPYTRYLKTTARQALICRSLKSW